MIKRIELINFMSHQHTVIEPSSGLTVLIGPNNCGKSAIVTALQILCNNPKSTYVLRHGEKECKIIVETNSGDVIQWSRKKSGSPKYIINGELFDRLKGKVPEQLHSILKMPQVQVEKETFDVHFGEQTAPLFLLGDKEKAAAQFFASSSDAIRLVEMQDRHKSNLRQKKADLKRITKDRQDLIAENEILAPVGKLHRQAVECENLGAEIAEEKKAIAKLEHFVDEMSAARLRGTMLAQLSAVLEVVPEMPAIQPTDQLNAVLESLESAQQQIVCADQELEVLAKLESPPELTNTAPLAHWIDDWQQHQRTMSICNERLTAFEKLETPPEILPTVELRKTIELLQTQQRSVQALDRQLDAIGQLPEVPQLQSARPLTELIGQYEELLSKHQQQESLAASVDAKITEVEAEIEDWLSDNPQCPTCGGEISKQQVLEGSGGHVHV